MYDPDVRPIAAVLVVVVLTVPAAVEPASRRASRITQASVRGHLEFLAGDALNGRGSGTRDEWLAAAYIGSQLRRWGVEPLGDNGGYVQDVRIERSEITSPPVLSFAAMRLTHGNEIAVTRLGAAKLAGPLQKYRAGVPVTRGAVLLLPQAPPQPAAADTAAAAIVLSLGSDQTRSRRQAAPVRPLVMQHLAGVPGRAAISLDRDSYAAIDALPEETTLRLDAEAKAPVVTHTWNAIGRLTGRSRSDKDDVILLTAHLDHLGTLKPASGSASVSSDSILNGADDDASGCVAVLELAEALASGKRPKRTVIFVWFGSEETGGAGASHFIDAPPVPLDRIVANLEFEMLGRPDKAVPPHTLWLTGYDRTNLGSALARRGARIVMDPHPEQNFFMRSDNIQLARRGVVAQTVSSYGLHTDYHQVTDEVARIDVAHMTDAIRSMVDPVVWLANSRFRPQWVEGKRP
jgi:hypothetical protein